jgi:exo-beta-1,3-glucanase (GH17 family)
MKSDYGARYVRLYGNCDESWFNDAWVAAAADAGLGVYALVWFGWDNPNDWKWRMDALVKTITTNPRAPWVVRNVAVGSEPLFDWALDPDSLAAQIYGLRQKLSMYGIKTTISEMPFGYQIHNNAPQVFKAIDFVEANILPFFDSGATTGANAWGVVSWSLDFFRQNAGPSKQIRITQTGWPSDTSVWKANTPTAVASVASEKSYYDLLDSKCQYFKDNGRIGYFAQIYADYQLGGWGILDYNGNPKFQFKPRTFC